MNKREEVYLFEIDKVDFDNIPDGATYIMDNDNNPVAVLMSAKYYKYLLSNACLVLTDIICRKRVWLSRRNYFHQF